MKRKDKHDFNKDLIGLEEKISKSSKWTYIILILISIVGIIILALLLTLT